MSVLSEEVKDFQIPAGDWFSPREIRKFKAIGLVMAGYCIIGFTTSYFFSAKHAIVAVAIMTGFTVIQCGNDLYRR